jgi:hypothetical protein
VIYNLIIEQRVRLKDRGDGMMEIISSHLTREDARKSLKFGEKIIKAGTFVNGSFGLYRHGNHEGLVLIHVWHIVAK